MISSTRSGAQLMIVARPDQSSSWRANLFVLAALAVPSLGAAVMFALAGAWPILPLAGIEMAALGIALYIVNRRLQYRQVITIDGDNVTVDKGYRCPLQSWRFKRRATGLSIAAREQPDGGPALTLHDRSDSVALGEFLGQRDTLELIELLRCEVQVRADSFTTEVPF